ncbi:MAG TPA: HAD family phosphatase [Bryobacteraceae bacterium]|nr:HAD family phosphatase [Bryobacteraceae bacterium]
MRIHPKAVIFDYGNVLCGPQPPADVEALAAILDLPSGTFTEMYWRFRVSYDAAELDPATYWRTVANASSRAVTSAQIDRLNELDGLSWCHPAPVMPQWARDIRREGLRTALLSNMPVTVRQAVEQSGWLPEFDVRTFSCEVGVCKPAPEIYRHCLNELGYAASEVLFLDDRPGNVRGAEAAGMYALLFTSPEQAAAELDERFALPVPLAVAAKAAIPPRDGLH